MNRLCKYVLHHLGSFLTVRDLACLQSSSSYLNKTVHRVRECPTDPSLLKFDFTLFNSFLCHAQYDTLTVYQLRRTQIDSPIDLNYERKVRFPYLIKAVLLRLMTVFVLLENGDLYEVSTSNDDEPSCIATGVFSLCLDYSVEHIGLRVRYTTNKEEIFSVYFFNTRGVKKSVLIRDGLCVTHWPTVLYVNNHVYKLDSQGRMYCDDKLLVCGVRVLREYYSSSVRVYVVRDDGEFMLFYGTQCVYSRKNSCIDTRLKRFSYCSLQKGAFYVSTKSYR